MTHIADEKKDLRDVRVREACRGQHTLELDLLADGGVIEASHDGSLPFCDRRRLTRWFAYGCDELIFGLRTAYYMQDLYIKRRSQ